MTLDATQALELTGRLTAVAAGVGVVELLAARAVFGTGGVFQLQGVQALHWRPSRLLALAAGREVPILTAALAGLGVLAVAGPFTLPGKIGLILALACRLVMAQRKIVGSDGAEQLITITLLAVAVGVLPAAGADRVTLAVVFIGAQLTLAYTVSGVAKLVSRTWRSGAAIAGIVNTRTYGLAGAAALVRRVAHSSLVLGWTVMLFESLFLLAVLGPQPALYAALAMALLFHLGCAVVMGLNDFLLAFPATFPCVVFLGALV